MPLVPTVIADGDKISELAAAKYGTKYGARSALAASIGRQPKSISNMRGGRRVSVKFATQIAEALGVSLDRITLPDEAEQDEPAEQPDSEAA
jgi:plasmid maintenance system antidote protein VapI